MDDFCLFFRERSEADRVLAILTKIIGSYELEINPDKTEIVEVKELVRESWKYLVGDLRISDVVEKQKDDIHRFFESLFSLEQKFKDESLIKYGLKVLSTQIIKKPNWPIAEAYLLKCGNTFPNSLQVIVRIFETYHLYDYPLDEQAITRFCNSVILQHAVSDRHSEVAWALWLALRLEIKIEAAVVRAIQGSASSVCLLLVLDLQHRQQTRANLPRKYLKNFAEQSGLYSSNWLLAYEAGRRKWLGNKDCSFISSDKFFQHLLANDVQFYDGDRDSPPLFSFKDVYASMQGIADIWVSDDDIDEYFEFDEVHEDYMDVSSKNDDEVFF